MEINEKSYKQRIEESQKPLFKIIQAKFPGEEFERFSDFVHEYAGVSGEVYMEIGMKCGAILAMQLLSKPKEE